MEVRLFSNISDFVCVIQVGGVAPYTAAELGTFEMSRFPCGDAPPKTSACCLLDYRDDYTTGVFALNITDSVDTCDITVQNTPTKQLFDSDNTQSLITGLLYGYAQSSVSLMAESGFRLSLGMNDLA